MSILRRVKLKNLPVCVAKFGKASGGGNEVKIGII